MTTVKFYIEVEFDDNVTDAETIAEALDTLMYTAMSTPGVLDDYGSVEIGLFYPEQKED